MPQLRGRTLPKPGELWLSRAPYLMVAQILEVEPQGPLGGVVSYQLLDEQGYLLEQVDHAVLDDGWWRAFQPLKRRYG